MRVQAPSFLHLLDSSTYHSSEFWWPERVAEYSVIFYYWQGVTGGGLAIAVLFSLEF